MKVFLTGKKHIGKSSVIDRFLEETGVSAAGFRTVFNRDGDCRRLFMQSPDGKMSAVVAHSENGRIYADTEQFNAFAPRLIDISGSIVLMDELGFLESDAHAFHAAVMGVLDSGRDVLGVIREGFPGWTAEIARRSDVEIITVTEENRDSLPLLLRQKFFNRA